MTAKSTATRDSHVLDHSREGWEGWDEYAPFYDWENARTLGRRDVPFWERVALAARGPVLELGCGTGRVSLPLARAGIRLVGVDRSAQMLERALKRTSAVRRRHRNARISRVPNPQSRIANAESRIPNPESRTPNPEHRTPTPESRIPSFVRGDIRHLPFARSSFSTVLAPYGVLQSILRDRDLAAALQSVAAVTRPGGLFGIDLVPDVPHWKEYRNRVQMRGRAGRDTHLTLVETVRQDRRRRLTMFDQTYIERRGRSTREHRFQLTFRTLTIPDMIERLDEAGFTVEAVLGDYRGRPIDLRSDVWIILARRSGIRSVRPSGDPGMR